MPVICSEDSKGKYCKWGSKGKKYYFNTERGKKSAEKKALEQGKAIKAKGGK